MALTLPVAAEPIAVVFVTTPERTAPSPLLQVGTEKLAALAALDKMANVSRVTNSIEI